MLSSNVGSRNMPHVQMCSEKSIPTLWMVIGNSKWKGVLRAKILEAKYKAKLGFLEGRRGAKQKPFHGGSMDIFWNCTTNLYHVSRLTLTCWKLGTSPLPRDSANWK